MTERAAITALILATAACGKEPEPPAPPPAAPATATAAASEAQLAARARAVDCDRLGAAVVLAQKRLLERGDMAYGAESYETLASLRDEIARTAGALELAGARSRAIAEEYRELNAGAADAERRAAAAMRKSDGAAIRRVAAELTTIAERERKLLAELAAHCPSVIP